MHNNILLVEDDTSIVEMVKSYLEKENFVIDTANNGEIALNKFTENDYDLILLDLMLPKISGKDLIPFIREKSSIPVIILSAKSRDLDKAILLGIGADDYISKPFSLIELSARINAVLRRANQYSKKKSIKENKIIHINNLCVDLNNFSVKKNGNYINLTSKEFQILKLFVTNPKRVFTKGQLYTLIWKEDYVSEDNVINVHIQRLRKKIEDNPSKPIYIKTLWGIGYKLGDF